MFRQHNHSIDLRVIANIHGPVQAANGDLLSNTIPLLDKRLLGSLCGGERGVKCKQDAHKEGETARHHKTKCVQKTKMCYARSWKKHVSIPRE
jgi:hypothetical protein